MYDMSALCMVHMYETVWYHTRTYYVHIHTLWYTHSYLLIKAHFCIAARQLKTQNQSER